MAKSPTFLDVRTPAEFAGEHLPGAINVPLDSIAEHISTFKALPKPIIVYCLSGNRSAMAVAILRELGVSEVINGGGMNDLQQMFI